VGEEDGDEYEETGCCQKEETKVEMMDKGQERGGGPRPKAKD
jgi:hypothetical protein